MHIGKTYQYSQCSWSDDNDFQVLWTENSEKSRGIILLVPAPWSSPFDAPVDWKENQRIRLATKIKEEWYTVLTMIPPGKPNHYISWEQSTFSFRQYARCIESVLYRDIFKKSVTHIVTSSLGQIATILALHNNKHQLRQQRKIIIWAPIDSLQHVLTVQKKQYWCANDVLIKQYALKNWLTLDPSIYHELQDNTILTLWINNLFDAWYSKVSIYGNDNDLYYTWKDEVDIMKSYFFQDKQNNDPFNHSFSEENAQKALQLVTQFLNNTFVSINMITLWEWFIRWFFKKQSMR